MFFNIYRIFHLMITGLISVPIAFFIAGGALEETSSNAFFVHPTFLLFIVAWLCGSVMSFIKQTKIIGLVLSGLPALYFVIA